MPPSQIITPDNPNPVPVPASINIPDVAVALAGGPMGLTKAASALIGVPLVCIMVAVAVVFIYDAREATKEAARAIETRAAEDRKAVLESQREYQREQAIRWERLAAAHEKVGTAVEKQGEKMERALILLEKAMLALEKRSSPDGGGP